MRRNYILALVGIGGIVPAFYTVGLNYTVEQVEKKFMAQANGYFVMMYGAGTILGPLIGATLVDLRVVLKTSIFSALNFYKGWFLEPALNKQYGYWVFA